MKIRKLSQLVDKNSQAAEQARERAKDAKEAGGQRPASSLLERSDKVSLNLGRVINQEFSSEKLESERAEKVKQLKELVRSGQYSVSSQAVAGALAKEIAIEIASANASDEG